MLLFPEHTTCLKSKRLCPKRCELPAINLAIFASAKLHLEASDSADRRVDLIIVASILLFLLFPGHREVSYVAVEARADIHLTHSDEEKSA